MRSRREVCTNERGRAGLTARALIAVAIQLAVARTAFAETQALDQKSEPSAEEKAEIERLRKEASETLLKGEFDRARKEFEAVLKLAPGDEQAERDAARAAAAAGEFEYAVEALEKAHHFEHHTADPELHYLRGEALYTLGRDEEAGREHHIAELEIGPEPKDRMRKLWLARIYGRRGYVVLADRLYESMLPPPPAKDTEVALNQADAHLINKDWTGGAKVLRRYLAVDPSSVRAREMLAWALEAGGDLEGEIAVRRSLVTDQPTPANKRDYGRALERASDFRGARDAYGGAVAAGPSPESTLVISYDRMRYRTTPELAGGGQFRSDPQAWAWHVQTGGALPFGSRHQLSLLAWHDSSTDWQANQVVGSNVLAESGTVTGLGASALFANRRGGWVSAGVDARVSSSEGVDSAGVEQFGPIWKLRFGGQLEVDTPVFSFMQISARADLNEQWNEAPVTVEKAGAQTGAIAHLFLFPESRVVLRARHRAPVPVPGEPGGVIRHRGGGAPALGAGAFGRAVAHRRPAARLGRRRLQLVGQPDAHSSGRGARRTNGPPHVSQ